MSSRFEISSVNRGLFNRDLLASYVDSNSKERAKRIKEHFKTEKNKNPLNLTPRQLNDLSEDDTIDYYINPILECLGFKYRRKLKDTKSRFPDIWLFNEDPEEVSSEYLQRYNLSILEAKKYKVDLDIGDSREERPPQQLISYIHGNLQFNDRKKWGILTNGYKWRLYTSDGIDKFIEFDIDHALENPEELELFCLIFSPDAFKIDRDRTDLLSKLQKASLESWVTVTTEIEERGNDVLLQLMSGFYENSKDLAKAKNSSYETLFQLLYVLYIESKHLIPRGSVRYAEKSLRTLLHDIHETTFEEYEISKRLTSLFLLYRDGEEILPPNYGGEHFRNVQPLKIKNKWLKSALDLLTVFEADRTIVKFFDYSSLNVELIGNIYEGTLGLVFDHNNSSVTIKKLKQKTGSEVHSTGTTYTPPNVVKYLIEAAIPEKITGIPTICDPACGSGHFLIQALRHLARCLDFSVTGANSLQEHKRKIAKEALHGVDINSLATRLARLMLVIETAEIGKTPLNFEENIREFNALLTPWKNSDTWLRSFNKPKLVKSGGFDFVVGNPPYVRADEPGEMENRAKIAGSKQYDWLYKKWDLFIPFIELAFGLTRSTKGKIAFVVSDGITYAPYAEKCTSTLSESGSVVFVSHFSAAFEGWAFPATCFLIDQSNKKAASERRIHKDNFPNEVIERSSVANSFIHPSKEEVKEILGSWNGLCLGDLFYVSVGMVLNRHEKLKKIPNFQKEDLISEKSDDKHPIRYIDNDDLGLGRFVNGRRARYIEYGPNLRAPAHIRRPTFPELHAGKRLLLSRSKKNNAAVLVSRDVVVSDNTVIAKSWRELTGINNRQISKKAAISKKIEWLTLPQGVSERIILEELSEYCSEELLVGILLSDTFKRWIGMDKRHKHVLVPDVISELPIPISGRKLSPMKKAKFGIGFQSFIGKLEKMDAASAESPVVGYIEQIVKILVSGKANSKKALVLKSYLDKLVEIFYRPVMAGQSKENFSLDLAVKRILSTSENASIKTLIEEAQRLLHEIEGKEKKRTKKVRAS